MEQTPSLFDTASPGVPPFPATGGAEPGAVQPHGPGGGSAPAASDQDTLAHFAATEFRFRQRVAHELVGAGKMDPIRAESALRAWLAIACLAHADLPELAEGLAARRVTYADGTSFLTEGELRSLAAAEISPRERWQGELARARDAALSRTPADPADAARQQGLFALAGALIPHIPCNGA